MWIKPGSRILRTLLAAGNFKLAFGENVFARSRCRLVSHDVGSIATYAFLTGLGFAEGVGAEAARRLTKSDNTENDGCGDQRRGEKAPCEQSVREGHRLQGEFQKKQLN